MNKLQQLLIPKKLNPKFNLRRFGVQDYDGGYILIDNLTDKTLDIVGFGVDGDYSCELDLQKQYNGSIHLYDGTVDINIKEPNVYFYKQNISKNNINDILNLFDKIVLKMDIEGSEYEVFNHITSNNILKIAQMSIEFHFPYTEEHYNIFKQINLTHKIFHVAANNCCGVMNNGIPAGFEISYINREYCDIEDINDINYPTSLDRMNTNLKPWPLLFKWW